MRKGVNLQGCNLKIIYTLEDLKPHLLINKKLI